jgi:stage II sporulation protein D
LAVIYLLRATVLALICAAVTAGTAAASFSGIAGFTPPALRGTPQFVLTGHGWGHGIGMSQYGAYGYAQKGFTFDQIVEHYYPGTELTTTTVKNIRVLLGTGPSFTVSSTAPWKLRDGTAPAITLKPGTVTLNPELKLKLPGETKPETFAGPLTFSVAPTAAPLVFKKPYRGSFIVTSDGKALTLVNAVPLDQYLYGVVPSEMPFTWLPQALEAQAVAARSYALAVRKTGPFDVYPDTRSQVYGGVSSEKASANAAVDATSGKVLMYGGKAAFAYFFSTSGGRTAAIADVWNSAPVPYLVSVPDPYDSISPYHDWGPFTFTATQLAKALKARGRLLDVQTTVGPSERVTDTTTIGDKGQSTMAGTDVRAALGLRSTWFRIGVLALDPLPAKVVPYGSAVTLTGLGRGLSDLRLEQRPADATARTSVRAVRADAAGAFSIPFKAAGPADFRVVGGGLTSPETSLAVAPVLALKVAADYAALTGTIRPTLPGTSVQIQQANAGGGWSTLARTTASSSGRFSALFDVTPGAYRARVAAAHGWAAAVSPKVVVG